MNNSILQNQCKQGRLEDVGNFPKVVLLDSVSYCNLRCSMCVHDEMTRTKGTMSWELFTKIIDEIAVEDQNIRVWLVFFGEALILKKTKPTIFDMITYAKNKGLTDVVLNSNANLMDEDSAICLIKSGLDAIYFGVDAFTPETYVKLRVGGNYRKVINNIRNLIELKKKIKAEDPEIFVQFVEMDVNIHEKEDFINFWEKQGVTVKIRPKVSWGGLIDAPNLTLSNQNRWPCYWAMQTMSITDTGKVVKCAVDLDARYVAGDVNTQSLKEIWNNKLKKFRQLHISKEFDKLPDDCRDCRDWQSARADFFSLNK
jgi:radical SAM protein with 4Fe4S-binding SPASM domain